MALLAVTRKVSSALGRCELTFLDRSPIDVERARQLHHGYELALATLGCRVFSLPEEPDLADSVFVEDTAVVLDELAIVTRPGVASRRPETPSIARTLAPLRELRFMEEPGTLDGGDVLRVGRVLYVGRSSRSNEAGIRQLGEAVRAFGYQVEPLPVRCCLHLKSAATLVAEQTLLVNPAWVDSTSFAGCRCIEIAPEEPHAANALRLNEWVIYSATHRRTCERLQDHGIRTLAVELSEMEKAEGAVTCCSLIVET